MFPIRRFQKLLFQTVSSSRRNFSAPTGELTLDEVKKRLTGVLEPYEIKRFMPVLEDIVKEPVAASEENAIVTSESMKFWSSCLPLISYTTALGEQILNMENRFLLFNTRVLKLHSKYDFKVLSCISGVDLMLPVARFAVVYELLSVRYQTTIRVKTFANETTIVPSLCSNFINANWWEREVWDMFGIYFVQHPELRRILTDYGFEGYPLRKDFPVTGYVEAQYSHAKKCVHIFDLVLPQEMRQYKRDSVWNHNN
jgi:NADH/F420H2 dehydrogenase subunit C